MSKFLHIVTAAGQDPEILVHGPIGKSMWSDEGVTGEEFTNALNKFPKGTKVTVGVNSQGGAVGEGMSIYNAIERRSDDVTCRIDGYALSIASFFPQAAGRVVSPPSSIWMIHRASSWSMGNADQMRKDAEMLDTHDSVICAAYCARTGKDEKTIRKAMDSETWMTGKEAIDYGLADEEGSNDVEFSQIDSSRFKNCPQNFKTVLAAGAKEDSTSMPRSSSPAPGNETAGTEGQGKQPVTASAAPLSTVTDGSGDAGTASLTNKETRMETSTTAAVAPPASNSADEVAKLRADLLAEKKTRIGAEVRRRAANKVANDKLDWWLTQAMADESAVYAQLDAMRPITDGNEPIGPRIEGGTNRIEEIKRLPTAMARYEAFKKDWNEIIAYAQHKDRGLPMNSNTFTSTLTTAFLIDGSVTKLQNRWALLKAYARDFSTDPYKPKATGHLKFVTGGATGQTDPTNWESGNSTVTDCTISVSDYAQSFQVSQGDLNNGLRMENLIEVNAAAFADAITQAATAPITVANYETGGGQTSLIRSSTTFGFSDLATLWGQLKKASMRSLLLDGEYLARIINTPTLFQVVGDQAGGGWRNFGWEGVYLNTNWTGADTSVRGFACHPQAIGAISGLPVVPPNVPGNTLQQSVATVPDVQVSFLASQWFSLATRTFWMSYDIMFGATVLDNTAGVLIKSS